MDVLRSVCLRSVGKNPDKARAFSGVLGITFLKASAMAEEMYAAMCCRGFTGEYEIRHEQKYSLIDLMYILVMVGCAALYIYLS